LVFFIVFLPLWFLLLFLLLSVVVLLLLLTSLACQFCYCCYCCSLLFVVCLILIFFTPACLPLPNCSPPPACPLTSVLVIVSNAVIFFWLWHLKYYVLYFSKCAMGATMLTWYIVNRSCARYTIDLML
jgi:hypothetical protein